MSTLEVSNLNDGTTTLATTYVTNGSSKVWINWNGITTTSIRDSLNVSSVTDNGTGDTTISYTSSLSAAYNYSMADYTAYYGNQKFASYRGMGSANKLAASVNIVAGYVSGTGGQLTAEDIGEMNLIMQGDLA
jgi:hypothetical protein